MINIFEIGEIYENENGRFRVIGINDPNITIQYLAGGEKTLRLVIQERIQDRMRAERAIQVKSDKKVKKKRASIKFSGFLETDFKDNVSGTSWRNRSSLGGLVAQTVSDLSAKPFKPFAVYRKPRFFVFPAEMPIQKQEEGVKLPKFVVSVDETTVFSAFYLEKADRKMGKDWYWARLLKMLKLPEWQEKIEALMVAEKLVWVLDFEGNKETQTILFSDDLLEEHPEAEKMDWVQFLAYLKKLDKDIWCNLYLGNYLNRQDALDLGRKVANPISHIFVSLNPFYQALLDS